MFDKRLFSLAPGVGPVSYTHLLAAELGVEWTDLWNVTRADQEPDVEHDSRTGAAKPLPPKENVHQPGDGWICILYTSRCV